MKQIFGILVLIAIGIFAYYFYFGSKTPVSPPPPPPQIKPAPPKEVRVNYGELISMYEPEAKAGNQVAKVICKFANYQLEEYDDGEKFVIAEADPKSGVDILEKIADSKHPFLKFIKAYCQYYGIGTEQDCTTAVSAFKEISSLECAETAYAVALIRGNDEIEQDKEKGLQMLLNLTECHYKKVKTSLIVESDGFYATSGFYPRTKVTKYPPAGLILGNIYAEEKVFDKATQSYIKSYVSGMKTALPKLSELFRIMYKESSDYCKKKIDEFENTAEFQKQITKFQEDQKIKNKMLVESQPDYIATETKVFKEEILRDEKAKILQEYFAPKGWILYNDGKKGIPIELFKHDMTTGVNLASEYLQKYYKQNKKFSEDGYENAKVVADKLRDLAVIAKETEGISSDYCVTKAFQLILSSKLEPNLSTKILAELSKISEEIRAKNSSRPSPISIIAEKYILLSQNDILDAEENKINADIEKLDSSAPIKAFAYKRGRDAMFDKKKRPDEQKKAGGYGFYYSNSKGEYVSGYSPNMSIPETFKSGADTSYVVMLNTEEKIVSSSEFNTLKRQFDEYIKNKKKLTMIKDAIVKKVSANQSFIRKNDDLLRNISKEKVSQVKENFKGFST